MDDRQTQIRQGAGLEESRVNQDLIDFLNKWSSPLLMVLAIAALTWAGLQWYHKWQIQKVDQAFSDLDAALAGENPSPASLRTVATEFAGVRSVPEMALLDTIDLYLGAYIRGVEPGAAINPATGMPSDENMILDETQRAGYLDQAGTLAQQVIDMTAGKDAKAILAVQAIVRLAVVKESKRDFAGAKSLYAQAQQTASDAGFPVLASFAQQRAERVESLGEVVELPAQDQLAPLPGEEPMDIDSLNELLNSSMPELESDTNAVDDAPVEVPAGEPEAEPETETP